MNICVKISYNPLFNFLFALFLPQRYVILFVLQTFWLNILRKKAKYVSFCTLRRHIYKTFGVRKALNPSTQPGNEHKG